ncbi:MAG: stimulus-sensing domain-containing protein, partial [Pseudomonadota bacterium]|nr:stimulus-sensing domain-containing protein [Pseudomonadota bacterium]
MKTNFTPEQQRSFGVSQLTWRILAINILALGALVAGLLFVSNYRQNLIQNEIAAMTIQAEMFAAALAEASSEEKGSQKKYLKKDVAIQIVRRLAKATGTHARLISKNGKLLIDSAHILGSSGTVQVEDLPPPINEAELIDSLLIHLDKILRLLLGDHQSSNNTFVFSKSGQDSKETKLAMAGEYSHIVRTNKLGQLTLMVAMPVQHYKEVLGVIALEKGGVERTNAVFEVRLEILMIFCVALLVTILLSIYLAGTIARPIQRMAAAADMVRRGIHRQHQIPNLKHRADEIGQLSTSLREMTEALWNRMDAIERFAADVSHEIKNPLTSLRSAVETATLIKDQDRQKRLMSIILDDIERLDRLISDISDASRLDSVLSR